MPKPLAIITTNGPIRGWSLIPSWPARTSILALPVVFVNLRHDIQDLLLILIAQQGQKVLAELHIGPCMKLRTEGFAGQSIIIRFLTLAIVRSILDSLEQIHGFKAGELCDRVGGHDPYFSQQTIQRSRSQRFNLLL